MIKSGKVVLILSLCCLLLSACGKSEIIRYYMLETKQEAIASEAINQNIEMVIGLGPVNFPDYLKRSQIVMRDHPTEVIILNNHKWAESLEENFIRVLAQNLFALQPSARIISYPSRQWSQVKQQVIIDVNRFDSDTLGETVLETKLTLIRNDDPENAVTSLSSLVLDNGASEDYASMVDVMSRLVQQLAMHINDLINDSQ
jgi:uncharacterized protein